MVRFMKTPEQIASETLTRSTRNPMDVHAHIVAAIEADRAQRKIVNWDEAGQLVQAYYEASEGYSGDAEHEAAMEIVYWVESTLEGSAR